MPLSRDQFVRQLLESGLFAPAELKPILTGLPDAAQRDGEKLARELVHRKHLTAYQAQVAFQGKGPKLVLGNYKILDKLGQGGMGMVLKAQHVRMQRIVALKVLSASAMKTKGAVERFHREVRAAGHLTHPHIVTAFDADEAGGTHFLVMQYVEGTDLSSYVKKQGPLAPDKAIDCILQAARGLEYAHQQNVVHRDIKPANLMLDLQGTVRILDMGLARFSEAAGESDLTNTGQIMGTVDYMAPEQAIDPRKAGPRADVYSLGVTLWYLLAGRPLFEGANVMAKLVAHREAAIPSLTGVCPAAGESLNAIFQKMVAKTPEARYASMSEVVAALERCQAGKAVSSLTPVVASGEESRLSGFLKGVADTQAGTGASLPAFDDEAVTRVEAETSQEKPASTILSPARSKRSALKGKSAKRPQVDNRPLIAFGLGGGVVILIVAILLSLRGGGTSEPAATPSTANAGEQRSSQSLNDSSESESASRSSTSGSQSESEAPEGDPWVELFNGENLDGWVSVNGTPPIWKIVEGTLEAAGPSIRTVQSYPPDFEFHFEFWVPKTRGNGQSKGNSGIYLLGRLELQILDMHDNAQVAPIHGCGALYGLIAPRTEAYKPPRMWQTFHGQLHSPRPGRDGRLTLIHNGLTVIDDAPVPFQSSLGSLDQNLGEPGPIMLQSHGAPVRFRNLRVRRIPALP